MPKISRRPSIKMQRLAHELVRTGNGAQAAINAGYQCADRHIAGTLTAEYLEKPSFKIMVLDELNKAGATKTKVISVIYQRMTDETPQNAGVSLSAAKYLMDLYKECELEPENQSDNNETHQILREPLEVRRWFLLSGRMPTEDERKLLTGLKNGEAVNPDLLAKMLSGKK